MKEISKDGVEKELHIAPMLHVSTREFRQFLRILTKRATLWTEMVVDETLVFAAQAGQGTLEMHLGYETNEHPIVCQVGGITPDLTAVAVSLVSQYGYDEINLNVDCPSSRVSGKRDFGAALMKQAERTCELLQAIRSHTDTPFSVKCRVGVDNDDDFEFMVGFISRLSTVCNRFVLHARKCVLRGLSPAQNRIVPPLNYPRVYALCERFPHVEFYLNGGIPGLKAARDIVVGVVLTETQHSVPCRACSITNGSCISPPRYPAPSNLRGCMFGWAVMDNPSQFWDVDRYWYGEPTNPCQTRRHALDQYCAYLSCTYPRRCCDSDPITTKRIPAPKVQPIRDNCDICAGPYDATTTVAFSNLSKQPVKITSRVMDRSFQPVLSLFFNLPRSKAFRRRLDDLSSNLTIRLDSPFVKTEDLKSTDTCLHVAPDCSGCT
jgi:tRNA-dihydrouridine synthase A